MISSTNLKKCHDEIRFAITDQEGALRFTKFEIADEESCNGVENASSISLARSENTTNHVEKKWNYKTEEQQLVNNKNITLDRKESLCVGKHATS